MRFGNPIDKHELVRLRRDGWSIHKVSRHFGVSNERVSEAIKELRLPLFKNKKPMVNLDRLKSLINAGLTQGMISNAMGISRESLSKTMKDQGWKTKIHRAGPTPNPLDYAEVTRLRAEGVSVPKVARALHVTSPRVSQAIKDLGLPFFTVNSRGKGTIVTAEVIRLNDLGQSQKKIAEVFDVTRSAIARHMKTRGIKPARALRGRRFANPISDSERDNIELLAKQGLIQIEIARLYDCNQGTISRFMILHDINTSNGRGRKGKISR